MSGKFLTHTVQMKLSRSNLTKGFFEVLNPHGSDETLVNVSFFKNKIYVLNPHGSDETLYRNYLTGA